MKNIFWLFIIILSLFSCRPKQKVNESLQKQVDSLQTVLDNVYKPGFGESMNLIHHHFTEIWQAGKDENWKYAAFEINEMKEAVENIEKYQKDREEVSQLIMFDAPVDSLILSVKNHNQKTFSKNYKKLLHTCNACHLKTKYEFIQIKMPE
jgi:hypothetical protein